MDQAGMYRGSDALLKQVPAAGEVVSHHVSEARGCADRNAWRSGNTPYRMEVEPAISLSHRVDIVIYPGFQSLDALGAISVLSHANRQLKRRGNPKLLISAEN
jgi:hypothetical protein